MPARFTVRHDVVVSVRYTLTYYVCAGIHTLDEFHAYWEAAKPAWSGTAPKAVDASRAEIEDALYAMGVLRGNHVCKAT